ncbi:hypothetical protein Nmel_014977 [Mimus melanotis]
MPGTSSSMAVFPLQFDVTSGPRASSIWLGKSKQHIFPSVPKCTTRSLVMSVQADN